MITRMQQLMARWSLYVFGEKNVEITPHIRALRLLEEVLELGQADGVTLREIATIIQQVYSKEPGERFQEAGGVATCLFAYCDVAGLNLEDVFFAEFGRIMNPAMMEKVRRRNLEGDKIGFRRSDQPDLGTSSLGQIGDLIRYNSEQVILRRVVQAQLRVALGALQKAATTFRDYARLHRAKDTVDGSVKALRNDEMATLCEEAMIFEPNPDDYGRP